MVSSAANPSTSTNFCLLGPVVATVDGADVVLGGRRQVAVLARLLLSPSQVVSMDQLVDALWDGDEPTRPDAAIRSYVSNLRRAIEPHREARAGNSCLVSVPPGYRLVVDRQRIDWVRFEDLVKRGQTFVSEHRYQEALDFLRDALALWQGEPCGGVPETDVFTAHRTRLHEIQTVAVELTFEAQLGLGQYRSVSATIEAAIAENPYRERLTELAMVALYRAGRQPDALALGHALRSRLLDQLGISPGPGIEAIEHKILNHDPSLAGNTGQATDSAQTVGTIDEDARPNPRTQTRSGTATAAGTSRQLELVGRYSERSALDEVVDRQDQDLGTLVLITGEYGTGKSELSRYLVHRLEQGGAASGWSRALGGNIFAESGDVERPLWAWAYALADLFLRLDPDLLARHIGRSDLQPLASLGPAIASPLELEPSLPNPGDPSDTMLAIVRLLRDLSQQQPLVIVLDDLHQADRSSVALAELTAESLARLPVTVVAAWRPGSTATAESTLSLGALGRSATSVRIDLGGFDVHEVQEMAEKLGAVASSRDLGDIHERSGGNPLFVTELLKLYRSASNQGTGLAAGPASTSLNDAVANYVGHLGAETVALLTVGALYRLPFTANDLAFVYPIEPTEIDAKLDAARRFGILTTSTDDPSEQRGYVFRQPVVAEILAGQLPIGDRALRHQSIGQLLGDRDADSVEIAYHLSLSPEPADHLLAMTLAIHRFRLDPTRASIKDLDKIIHRGLETATGNDDVDDLLCEAHLYLSWRSRLAGDATAWRQWANSALEIGLRLATRSAGSLDETSRRLLADTALNAVGRSPFPVGPGAVRIDTVTAEDLVPSLEQAMELLGDSPSARRCGLELYALRALSLSSPTSSSSATSQQWLKAAREARKLVLATHRRSPAQAASLSLACLDWFTGELPDKERSDVLERTTSGEVRLGEAIEIERHWHHELVERGSIDKAFARLHPMVRIADHSSNYFHQITARALLVRHLLWVGNTVDARRFLAQMVQLSDTHALSLDDAIVEQLFELRRLEGRARMFVISQDWLDQSWSSPTARAARAAILYATVGRSTAAGRWLRQAVEEFEWDRAPLSLNAGSLAWVAEAASMVGGEAGSVAAEATLPGLLSLGDVALRSPGRYVLLGPASYYAALASRASNETDQAIALLKQARSASASMKAGPAEYRCLRSLTGALRSAGHADESATAADEAAQLLVRIESGLNRSGELDGHVPTVTTDLWLASN